MQLLVMLKGLECLSVHFPSSLEQAPVFERLWNFNETIIEEAESYEMPDEILFRLYEQLPIDLQELYRTFEVFIRNKADETILLNAWNSKESIVRMETVR